MNLLRINVKASKKHFKVIDKSYLLRILLTVVVSLSTKTLLASPSRSSDTTPSNFLDEHRENSRSQPTVVVIGSRGSSLLGIAPSSSSGVVGSEIISTRPLLRTGELIELVPGMIATQHAGGGKANQYFFRGFNLDHGTDFRVEVQGVPINLSSHAHGQGYIDLNFLIPELVAEIQYDKGAYEADLGNFATAGASRMSLYRELPKVLSSTTVGAYEYLRQVTAGSTSLGNGTLLSALEISNYDGPWDEDANSRRINGVLSYTLTEGSDEFTLTAMAYRGIWNSSDQIPLRAFNQGAVSRFGTIDPTTGGDSNRLSLSGSYVTSSADSELKATAWISYYDLNLYSNFTYFLEDPVNGDQFQQEERRVYVGANFSRTHDLTGSSLPHMLEYGLQIRHDSIPNVALRSTVQRERLTTFREDEIEESFIGIYLQDELYPTDWFRIRAGLRGDFAAVDVKSDSSQNSNKENDAQLSPKLGLVCGPWFNTELYLNGGFGFHSNDARGATTQQDPRTGDLLTPVSLLTEARSAEVGIRTSAIPHLNITATLWYLTLQSELVYVGDAGNTEPLGASRRVGFELANYYQPSDLFSIYADYAYSRPRFTEANEQGELVPNSVNHTLVSGFTFGDQEQGPYLNGKWRYLGTRPLVQDGSAKGPVASLVDLRAGYSWKNLRVFADLFNLLEEDDYDIAYFYESRIPGENNNGVADTHFHPVEPRQVRLTVQYRF